MARFSEDNLKTAIEIRDRYPVAKSATIPLLHLAQEQDGYVTDDAMEFSKPKAPAREAVSA